MPSLHSPFNLYLFPYYLVYDSFNMHLYPCNSSFHKNKNPQGIYYSSQSAYDDSKSYFLNAKSHLLTSIFCFSFRFPVYKPCFLCCVLRRIPYLRAEIVRLANPNAEHVLLIAAVWRQYLLAHLLVVSYLPKKIDFP